MVFEMVFSLGFGFEKIGLTLVLQPLFFNLEFISILGLAMVSLAFLMALNLLFIRSHLEQSAVVWHSSLTENNRNDLERVVGAESQNIINVSKKYKKTQHGYENP